MHQTQFSHLEEEHSNTRSNSIAQLQRVKETEGDVMYAKQLESCLVSVFVIQQTPDGSRQHQCASYID